MNAQEVTLPGVIRVGADIIYNGGLYYFDTPIEFQIYLKQLCQESKRFM